MMFLVIYEIPTSVFLNNFVIVLIWGPKNVKVVHFLFGILLFQEDFSIRYMVFCG
jgi:hypothetical protein